jgi:hypothetical protein
LKNKNNISGKMFIGAGLDPATVYAKMAFMGNPHPICAPPYSP